MITKKKLDAWIKKAQFTVKPEYAPASSPMLLVVTVQGLKKFMEKLGVR